MTVSQTFKNAFFAQRTSEVPLILLTISHAELSSPILIVNHPTNIQTSGQLLDQNGNIILDHNGNPILDLGDSSAVDSDTLYIGCPFEVTLPNMDGTNVPRAKITVCNVDQTMVQAIRSITTSPDVTLSLILASNPEYVEYGPFEFKLTDVGYDVFVITGNLSYDNFLDEPCGGDRFTPGQFPGLF